MNINKTIERAKAILLTPRTAWPVIADEPATIADIYKGYVLLLAAIAPISLLLGSFLYGFFSFRFVFWLAVELYVGLLLGVYAAAWIVNALAETFGAQKDMLQAFKVVAYASTAVLLAGVAHLAPLLLNVIMLLGAGYSIYLLYLGLPHTMKCPQDRTTGYTAVVAIVSVFVTGLIVGLVVRG